jgi:Flp pilus assembly protein TadD
LRLRDWPAATRELRTAVRLDPTNLQAAQSLALVLKRSGDEDAAAAARGRVERLRALAALLEQARPPDGLKDRTLARRLGGACEAVGQVAEARGWYLLAIELDPLDAGAQRALFRLGGGTP